MSDVEKLIEQYTSRNIYFESHEIEEFPMLGGWVYKENAYTVIHYNTVATIDDQMTNIIHELIHNDSLILGHSVFWNSGDWDEERDTRRRTADLVLPYSKIKEALERNEFSSDYEAAEHFHVSYPYFKEVMNMYSVIYGLQNC